MDESKILIVDDDAEIRNIIHILLESEGFIIVESDNGEKALEKINDMILM